MFKVQVLPFLIQLERINKDEIRYCIVTKKKMLVTFQVNITKSIQIYTLNFAPLFMFTHSLAPLPPYYIMHTSFFMFF